MNETSWLWIGTVGMLAGSLLLFAAGGRRTEDEEAHTLVNGFVPLFAAVSYCAMALHQGEVTLPDGRLFLFARYVDWSVTTPVLLLGLSMTALHGARRRAGLVAGLIAADVVMIVTGGFFGASHDAFAKWLWYVTSCIAFLAIFYVLFGPLRAEAQARDDVRQATYGREATILAALWLIYPIVVLLGPDGMQYWDATLTTACVTVLDLVAKVGFGLIAMAGSAKAAAADLARDVTPASNLRRTVLSG